MPGTNSFANNDDHIWINQIWTRISSWILDTLVSRTTAVGRCTLKFIDSTNLTLKVTICCDIFRIRENMFWFGQYDTQFRESKVPWKLVKGKVPNERNRRCIAMQSDAHTHTLIVVLCANASSFDAICVYCDCPIYDFSSPSSLQRLRTKLNITISTKLVEHVLDIMETISYNFKWSFVSNLWIFSSLLCETFNKWCACVWVCVNGSLTLDSDIYVYCVQRSRYHWHCYYYNWKSQL